MSFKRLRNLITNGKLWAKCLYIYVKITAFIFSSDSYKLSEACSFNVQKDGEKTELLCKTVDPEAKRMIIGDTFMQVSLPKRVTSQNLCFFCFFLIQRHIQIILLSLYILIEYLCYYHLLANSIFLSDKNCIIYIFCTKTKNS